MKLPRVLAEMVGGQRSFEACGETVREALEDLARQRPALGLHFFDEAGSLRRHVLCFHNQVYARGSKALELPIEAGDTITLLNSVSGG